MNFSAKRKGLRKPLAATAITAATVFVCVAAVFPFFWMISLSLRDLVYAGDPQFSAWFANVSLENYLLLFKTRGIENYLLNSIVISLATTIISLFFGSLTAYGLARYNFKRREDVSFFLLSLRMLPAVASVIPFFLIATFTGLLDTHIILIIAYLTFNIPFTVWMMRGFFEEIPREMEEAALVDGCSVAGAIFKIVLPLALPGLIATAIFCIINSWNELVFALFLTTIKSRTLPTTVQMFLSVQGVQWNEMAAVGVVSTAPVLIFAMFVQKYMVRGLTFGAVKG